MNTIFIDSQLHTSILKQHERGMRRYFPINGKIKKGRSYLRQAYKIIYGEEPKDNFAIGMAILQHSLDKYVEKFDGKLWVRTIYKIS